MSKLLPFLLLIAFSCTQDNRQNKIRTPPISIPGAKENGNTPPDEKAADTLIVTTKAAVFYSPDSVQIEKIKKESGEDDFYTAADDLMYYSAIAREFLDSLKIPVMDVKNQRFIRFVPTNQTATLINLDTLSQSWGIYLFDPAMKPKPADMTDIKKACKNYFR